MSHHLVSMKWMGREKHSHCVYWCVYFFEDGSCSEAQKNGGNRFLAWFIWLPTNVWSSNFYGAKVIVIFILTRRYLNMKFNLFNRQIIELLAIWITFEAPLWVMWLQFCHMARKSRPENAIYLSPYTYFYFIFSSSSFNIKRICISSIYG